MDEITIRSYAKINLSIDVGPVSEDGYHPVDMIMQQIEFHDDVTVRLTGERAGISVSTNRAYLPTDRRNLAYKAAELMVERFGLEQGVDIRIHKRIPVAAGLAGGSGNGAAVIHAINALCHLDLDLGQVCALCEELGSDVPFSAVGQAGGNRYLPDKIKRDPMATTCARATGRGTVMKKVRPWEAQVVIAKPSHGVSTAEVYQGIDHCAIEKRPDNDRLEKRLAEGEEPYEDFVNVLEAYTLQHYPKVAELKEEMKKTGAVIALMSGSGPTVFGMFKNRKTALKARDILRNKGYEAYGTYCMR